MTRALRWLAVSALAALACACAPEKMAAPPFVPHAASGTVSWQPLLQREVKSAHEGATVEVNVKGGELLRLETPNDAPIAIGERVHASATGDVEEWSSATPHDHVVLLRPALFTTAIRFPKGAVDRALIGHGYDPGYLWFELESRVLDWASGPLPAPFPQIATPERIDFDAITALDRALADAVAAASDRDAAVNQAHAIRRVVGLRAARILRPVNGFPYFFDSDVEPEGHPNTRSDNGHVGYEVTPEAPLEIVVNGPTLLHVWSRAPRSEEGEVERVRVTEGGHERAISGATLPHVVRNTESDPSRPEAEGDDPAALSSLRRAAVHVPPGEHRYRVEMSGGAQLWIYPLRAREIVHLEDGIAGIKSETRQLANAEDACRGGSPAICAFALALGGKDAAKDGDDEHTAGWRDTIAKLAAPARDVAIDLARGGPRDPSLSLEVAASAGDDAALTKLSDAAARETDDVLRDSWMRAVLRGTRWASAGSESQATWTALLVDEAAGAKCAGASDTPWSELTHDDAEVATTSWHGVQAVDLMASVPCDAKGPVQISVDGETLTASPSSGHARWHVLVHGTTAHARRLDSAGGHVLAMRATDGACGAHWGQVSAPMAAASHPKLAYEAGTRSPGIEVWLREGASSAKVDLEGADGQTASVLTHGARGVNAIDERGTRWTRVARLPLPAWAAAGVVVNGGDDVAVRAIVRAPRWTSGATAAPSAKPAEPLDEARLIELSRAILALPPAQRGPAYLQRALVLAGGGAAKGAMADARAAKALGGGDGDPEAQVRAALRAKPALPVVLASSVKAFGVEPDFDPGAPRCKVGDAGPRGRLAQIEEQLKSEGTARGHAWDSSLAVRALEVAHADPNDPRAEALARRSMWGSRWQLVRAVQGGAARVVRPREKGSEGPVDPNGDLRGRVAAGDPFGSSSVTVTTARPARAILSGAPGASPHIDFVCIARDPAAAAKSGARCPIQIAVGDSPAPITDGPNGTSRAQLPPLPSRGAGAKLAITMRDAPGDWSALARIVFDREVPGSKNVANVGWVLEPPSGTRRFLVKANDPASLALDGPGLVRVDALGEPGPNAARVVASADGRDEVVPLDGTPITLTVTRGSVTVRAEGGAATIAIAQRVPRAAASPEGDSDESDAVAETAPAPDDARPEASSVLLDPNAGAAAESWRSIVGRSPRPLTPFQDDLGVVIAGVTASYGSVRADDPNDTSVDQSIEQYVGYRRRIESLSLWTISQVNIAERPSGAPTYGGSLTLYEDYDPGHFRLTGTLDYGSQLIDGSQVQTINPRGFAEYSWRATRAFFILPRLGFDGWYTTLHQVPKSTTNIDDSVFNAFRTERQTFVFLQSLFWLTPFFNDIYYLRARATYDVGNSQLSHVAMRPGLLLAFGQLDVNGYFETAWYQATPYVRSTAGITNSAGLTIEYNFWSGAGSLDIQPGVAGLWNDGGAYTVQGILNFMIGYRRGLRDYSSLELDFPEQLSDGVPWRGAPMGIAK
jgi:hypothetical protein